jgi:hypothetical protein
VHDARLRSSAPSLHQSSSDKDGGESGNPAGVCFGTGAGMLGLFVVWSLDPKSDWEQFSIKRRKEEK